MQRKKFRKYFLFFRYLHLKILVEIVSIEKKILLIGSQWVNKQS